MKLSTRLRTHVCGRIDATLAGQEVTLCGWVHRSRDHGGKRCGLASTGA